MNRSAARSIPTGNLFEGQFKPVCKGSSSERKTPLGAIKRYIREVALPYEGDDCLIWPFSKFTGGRARMKIKGRNVIASRYVCILAHGEPPTSKHEAAHNCGQGHNACVNPKHLRWATHIENQADKVVHGTLNIHERNGSAKLKRFQVIEIRERLQRGTVQTVLAAEYGISRTMISRIGSHRLWRGI